ncbi:histamine H3 receptor-like [Protopterus annectens]|uniref:histamine H3 receptor-like n=1 Tax=Protopterus annectens TaxID=7888 RepID=UPI001CFAE57B|nr:histamine H3 receptor-like [Protopterus annectens]
MAEDLFIGDINNSSTIMQNLSSFDSRDPLPLQSAIPHYSRSIEVILTISISLMVSVTVIGNGLVILAFFLERKIRTPRNYFLLNLAICDFFVGAFSIPLYTPYVLSGKWTLGKELCKVWLLTDSLLCFASEFSIVLISYDRFLSIIKAVEYQLQQTGIVHVLIKMAIVWVVSFLFNCPLYAFGEYLFGANFIPQEQCYISTFTWSLDIAMQVCTFILPFGCTTYFSIKIYWNLKNRSRQKYVNSKRACDLESNKEKTFSDDVTSDANEHALTFKGSLASSSSSSSSTSPRVASDNSSSIINESQNHLYNNVHLIHRLFNSSGIHSTQYRKNCEIKCNYTGNSLKLSKDKKVAKSLAVIVSAYGICWAPYRILMTCHTFDKAQVIDPFLYEISSWMLWFNSCINPLLYPFCHSSFKRAILKILCLKRH